MAAEAAARSDSTRPHAFADALAADARLEAAQAPALGGRDTASKPVQTALAVQAVQFPVDEAIMKPGAHPVHPPRLGSKDVPAEHTIGMQSVTDRGVCPMAGCVPTGQAKEMTKQSLSCVAPVEKVVRPDGHGRQSFAEALPRDEP